jgi:serine/threonine protein kinase
VIHRDLKPANILLDDEGRAFVADFGLAKLIEHDSGLSQTGAVLGSPAYMAPEQARGDQDQVSTASDIYGLGAILYHLVTGRPPHQADTALATLRRVMDEEIERPSRLNPRVDPDLEAILHKCLERDPARRYASADALASDLRLWLAGRATEARPAGPLLLLWKWSRRNPAYALLAAGLVASCLILFAYALSRQGDFSQTSGAPMEFMGTSVWIPPPAATVQNPTGISWTWVESDGRKTARLKLPSTAKGAVRVWLGRNAEPQQLQPGADGMVEFTVPSGVDEVRVAW